MDLSAKILDPEDTLSWLSIIHSSGAIKIRIGVGKTRRENWPGVWSILGSIPCALGISVGERVECASN